MDILLDRFQVSIFISLIKPLAKLQLGLLLEDDGMGRPSKLEMANLFSLLHSVAYVHRVDTAGDLHHADKHQSDLANPLVCSSYYDHFAIGHCGQKRLSRPC